MPSYWHAASQGVGDIYSINNLLSILDFFFGQARARSSCTGKNSRNVNASTEEGKGDLGEEQGGGKRWPVLGEDVWHTEMCPPPALGELLQSWLLFLKCCSYKKCLWAEPERVSYPALRTSNSTICPSVRSDAKPERSVGAAAELPHSLVCKHRVCATSSIVNIFETSIILKLIWKLWKGLLLHIEGNTDCFRFREPPLPSSQIL